MYLLKILINLLLNTTHIGEFWFL